MLLRVGQAALRGDLTRYAHHFDLLELRAEPGTLPRPARLREWAAAVPDEFVFSVALPRAVASLQGGPEAERALGFALRVADALGAGWLVLQTPAAATPSSRTRRQLSDVAARLRGEHRRVAWEPRGVWDDEQATALATELRLHLVRDLTRDSPPPGGVLYSRVLGLGKARRFGLGAAQRLASSLFGRDEAYVVLAAAGAVRGAGQLRDAVAEIAAVDPASC